MTRLKVDLCVIGAGSGGLSVAAGAVQMGARVALVEAGKMGGDCLNYGCVPSKALLAAGRAAHAMRSGARFGVAPAEPRIDYAEAMAHVARTIAAIAPIDSEERFTGLGVTVIRATARFTGPSEVQAGDTRIAARRFVIATGSRPVIPPVPGLEAVPYLTNETLFDLRAAPAHLLILGAGPIGLEMAQAHRRLGCRVTLVEAGQPLAREDPTLAAPVLAALGVEGVEILAGAKVTQAAGQAGAIRLTLDDGREVAGSHLLVATGRRPVLDPLDLAAAGVAVEEGRLRLTPGLRTTNRRIYAVGDAAGGAQFTHLAGFHAGIVLRQAMFSLPARADRTPIPRVTYTDPELAQVGLTEAEARARHGDEVQLIALPFEESDRARTEADTIGSVRLVLHRGRLLGAGIAGTGAGEAIGFWQLVLARKLKLSALAGAVLPYPTRAELCKRAAGAYFSPKLFDSNGVKRLVGAVQRLLP